MSGKSNALMTVETGEEKKMRKILVGEGKSLTVYPPPLNWLTRHTGMMVAWLRGCWVRICCLGRSQLTVDRRNKC